jgi:hypothetical protein
MFESFVTEHQDHGLLGCDTEHTLSHIPEDCNPECENVFKTAHHSLS